jgi:hypothetical protein
VGPWDTGFVEASDALAEVCRQGAAGVKAAELARKWTQPQAAVGAAEHRMLQAKGQGFRWPLRISLKPIEKSHERKAQLPLVSVMSGQGLPANSTCFAFHLISPRKAFFRLGGSGTYSPQKPRFESKIPSQLPKPAFKSKKATNSQSNLLKPR